ncbi:MAG: carboxylating nicotinate-nucleotide diphosphorylase [Phycisphaerales bacterium]|nr:carboxylating nicotinate-nucleotide diphosphorylase [Phycisphaerales bacterium]
MHSIDARDPSLDPSADSLGEFSQRLRKTGFVRRLIELARDEDLGRPAHDWTGELMFEPDATRSVVLRAREGGVVSGLAFLPDLIEAFAEPGEIGWECHLTDGDRVEAGSVIVTLRGNARAIVRLERTMLNLISRMCGIATLTRRYVDLIEGTNASICDTRKTTPGLRVFEKYAVRCGGGVTHRMGLHDAVLIKDNHIAGMNPSMIATELAQLAYKLDSQGVRLWFVQIEVDSLNQLEVVLQADHDALGLVLLDNMTPAQLRQAVEMRNRCGSSLLLEASGGVNERTVRAIAQSGVERISIGSLTHQAQSIDLGLDSD